MVEFCIFVDPTRALRSFNRLEVRVFFIIVHKLVGVETEVRKFAHDIRRPFTFWGGLSIYFQHYFQVLTACSKYWQQPAYDRTLQPLNVYLYETRSRYFPFGQNIF